MKSSETASWLLLGGMLCLLVVVCFAADKVMKLDASIATLFTQERQMQTITQEVTRPSGAKVTVSTVRLDNETLAAWIKRHDDAVYLLKQP